MNYEWRYWEIPSDISFLNIRQQQPDLKDQYSNSIQGDYFQGWQGIYQYVYEVLSGNRNAGKAEIAACERFVYDLNRNDLVFDKDEADFAITLCTFLCHPKGPLAGKPFYLMYWMQFVIGQIFAWRYSNQARELLRGELRFQKSFIAVARGNSKTVLAAALAVIIALITENGSPVLTTSATVQKQSRIAFEDISNMIKSASPSIRKRFQCLQNEIRILHNKGKIFPTSSESETLDGLRICGAIIDEVHAHPNSKVIDVLSTGMQSSKDPHMLLITTAGTNTLSYGREYMDYATDVAQHVIDNDRLLTVVYKVDQQDEADWLNEQVWEKANPALGHAVNLESLKAAATEATRNAAARANFLTKHLNVWVDFAEDSFVDSTDLEKCRVNQLDLSKYTNKECYIGIDLASVDDLSSAVLIFPNNESGIDIFQRSYLPETALDKLKPAIRDRYMKAHDAGELIITHTEVTDFDYIKHDIISWTEQFDVKGISIDAAAGGARFAFDLNEEHGLDVIAVKQGFGLSETAILFQSLVKDRKVKYADSLLEWGILNSLVVHGEYGDIRITKSKTDHSKKIDPCVATIIGLSQTILRESEYSYYEENEVRFL